MNHSIVLRTEPTVRQTEAIVTRIERALAARGVPSTREGPGRLRFRTPAPWRALRAGILLAITSGNVRISAGAGEHRQVRYQLNFTVLRWLAIVLSAAVAASGLAWPRASLLEAVLLIWFLGFGVPYVAAVAAFHRLAADASRDVIERRRRPRIVPKDARAGGDAPAPDRSSGSPEPPPGP